MKFRYLFLMGVLLAFTSMRAQVNYQPEANIPVDPEVKIGKLSNGLTYYIHRNAQPAERAEFYLILNAGAIQEDPDQNGLAHFCEHMAFNGTEHFKKHQIINYLQSIGMKFGPEINAFTSHDVTAYMLQKVPVHPESNIDSALLILFDWAGKVSYEPEEIDAERGVIHEEWRTGRGAMERLNKKMNKVILQGSKYAEHDVIGDINIIDNFPHEALIRFYKDWYRPQLQAVVAVGDFDPQVIEAKIQVLFNQLQNPSQPRKREIEPVPDHDKTLVSIETDKEAQYTMVRVIYKHNPDFERNQKYLREQLKTELFNQMMNARFAELQRQANPPFVYGYNSYGNLVKSKDAYMSFAIARAGESMRALEALLRENERLLRHGFTPGELERAKQEVLKGYENQFKEKNKRKSDQLVWNYFGHFLNDEPIPGPDFMFQFASAVLPGISLKEMNELPARWITDRNRVLAIGGPEKEGLIYPTRDEVLALLDKIEKEPVEPYNDNVADKPLLGQLPPAGKVVNTEEISTIGVTVWTLSNGAKVVLKPTQFRDDEILFAAQSKGGSSLYSPDESLSAQYAAAVIGESGLGDFDPTQLEKALSGKIVDLNPYIRDLQEGFNGSSSKKDIETLLQLTHLYFTRSRFDDNTFGAFLSRMKGVLENASLNPVNALRDTINVVLSNYSPYRKPMTVNRLQEINPEIMKKIFKERFADADGFTFFFVGAFKPEELKPLVEKYLGSLPKQNRAESWRDLGIMPPKGVVRKTVIRDMEDPKATVFVALSGEFEYNPQDRVTMQAISDILSFRYVETIREEEGGTYGAGVRVQTNKLPKGNYVLTVQFDCDPENAERLTQIVLREIQVLRTDGPKDDQVRNFKENKLKTWKESLEENNFWMSNLANADFNGDNLGDFMNYPGLVSAVTPEMVKEAAARYFNGDNLIIITLLPSDLSKSVKNPMLKK
ncbi:MAG: insulinase family protein [Bacteroidales bacterium]|nr:insulinase family protein [Bacteroidales bacterium]NPV36082.1 insulinase family protein [Bacteroidales bacterium]